MESNHLFNLTKIVLCHLTTRANIFLEPGTALPGSQLLLVRPWQPPYVYGTPGQSRTDRTTPFERVDFTNLSTGAEDGPGPGNRTPSSRFGVCCATVTLVLDFMEQRVRFELTILGICSPLHWASLPPLHVKLAYYCLPSKLAEIVGFEPTDHF